MEDKSEDTTSRKTYKEDRNPTLKFDESLGLDSEEVQSTSVPEINYTPTVQKIRDTFQKSGPINAALIVQLLYRLHPEYDQNGSVPSPLPESGKTLSVDEWLEKVQSLYEVQKLQLSSESDALPSLHGRLLIIGLCLLEESLYIELKTSGSFDSLLEQLREPLRDILSESGRKRLDELEQQSPVTNPDVFDSVPNWPDDPISDSDQDLLGRDAFARFLAKRITEVPLKSGAYTLHIYGPWGSGKSTLLNLLRSTLIQKDISQEEWLVINFNAWRYQHIRPPWWSLMDKIFTETKNELNVWNRLSEYWWRFTTGRVPFLLSGLVIVWLLLLIVFPLLRNWGLEKSLPFLSKSSDNISKIIALIGTVGGLLITLSRSLLTGSARAAKDYAELTHNPTDEIKRRFNRLIAKLLPYRVAILIDDLDRCQSSYVVDLLEGIQTIFREAPVVFVVAADRKWLNACYEEIYKKIEPHIEEPGKPLGTLFLEKAFRFSTPMPGIPEELKNQYWEYLLRLSSDHTSNNTKTARSEAKNLVKGAKSETDLLNIISSSQNFNFAEQRTIREESAVKLASPEIINRIEHTLKPYAHLLEPNPRAMKLLVNSYSANRALAILSEIDIEHHQLALWTILCSRWPQLADYLVENPEKLTKIGQKNNDIFPETLKGLCMDPDVVKVIKGNDNQASLSSETLKLCGKIRS